jgi:ATP-dependent 26S proteasome regulatory subunit
VFKAAREQDAVLFFDEADSLLSKRVATGESCSTSINQNRNTLMQELGSVRWRGDRHHQPV